MKLANNIFYRLVWLFTLFQNAFVLNGQTAADTTHTLPMVEIGAVKIRQHATGSTTQIWKTADIEKLAANTVADLLTAETGAYVKSYGQGTLATSSVRGGSAGHTLVLWNGLPIQSPMLGLLDLALLPIHATEQVSFTQGGNTAMWGSGAIGGVLSLDNKADFSQKMNLSSSTQAGSFGLIDQQVKVGLGNRKWQSQTRMAHRQADNDFYYFVAPGLPKRQQTNARLSQQWVGQDVYFTINPHHHLEAHFWHQTSNRQIPPTNVQQRSEAHQQDLATRLMLEYRHITNNGMWQVKTGFFEERLYFFDNLILLESRSHFRTYIADVTKQWIVSARHQLFIGNTHTHTQAWSAGYKDAAPTEYKTALFGSWKYSRKKITAQLSLRQELVNGVVAPPVPALGIDVVVCPTLTLQGKISRNYRLPTLNDRYWQPGGNTALLPESGWSQELTCTQTIQKKALTITASVSVFNRQIDNWILWSLQSGQSFWSANNLTKVWSRGAEPRLAFVYKLNKIEFQVKSGYNYVRSTNEVAVVNPKMAVGEQLLYTPVHQGFGSLSVTWKSWYFTYQHTFVGATSGINQPINAYRVATLRLQYTGSIASYKATAFFNFNNLWNAQYMVVERRPMPGIHFLSGISLSFNKKV